MAGRRGRVTRAVSCGPKNNLWAVVIAERVTIAAGGQTADQLLTTADWSRGAVGGSERATILRVRGYMSFTGKNAVGARGSAALMAYLTVVDEDITTDVSPGVASTYIDEDILWTRGHSWSAVAAGENRADVYWDVDVKAMRKIRIGQDLRMVWSNFAVETLERSMVLRTLIRIGGN